MANFWSDYFRYGTGNKIINTIGGVMLRNKWKDLMSKYNGKQEEESSPTLNQDTSTDTGFDREQGTPKQDLNQQPVPEYQPPTVGGYKPIVSTSEEQQNEQEFGTKTPNAFMDMIGNSNSNQQIPLLNNQDKSKVDFSGIGMMIDPIKRKQYNDKLNTDVLEFMNYAQRFPEQGERYKSMLDMFVKQKQQQAPEKIEVGKEFTDRNGYLYERQYNPYKNEWLTVPVTGQDGKQIQTKLPEMRDFDKYHYFIGENGNAWFTDETGAQKDTGIKYQDWNPTYGLQERTLGVKEMLAEDKLNKSNNGNRGNNGNNGSNGTGNGTVTFTADKKPMVGNIPLKHTTRKIVTNKVESTNDDGSPKTYKRYEETIGGYWLGEQWISDDQMGKFADDFTKGNTFKNNLTLNRMQEMGIGVTKDGQIYDDKGTKWSGLFNDMRKQANNPKHPNHEEAKKWMENIDNIQYAKKLGLF